MPSELVPVLIGAVVGGLISLIAALVTAVVTHRLSLEADRVRRERDRADEESRRLRDELLLRDLAPGTVSAEFPVESVDFDD